MSTVLNSDPQGGNPQQQQQQQQQVTNTGNQTFDFRPILPEELRSEKVFDSFKPKDAAEFTSLLAKGYVHAQRQIGQKGVILPGDDASEQQLNDFYNAIGRPESPDKYEFTAPEGMDLSSEQDKAMIADWRKELHSAGIPAKAATRLIGKFLTERHAERQAAAQQSEQWLQEAKGAFGQKFDESVNFAKHSLSSFDPDKNLLGILNETGLGNHPAVLSFLAQVGKAHAESSGPKGTTHAAAVTNSAQAQAEITAFERDHRDAIFDGTHKDHEWAIKRRQELYALAFPKVVG